MRSAFPSGWWSFELEGYRASDSTYELFLYESLPPLNEGLFQGDFRWLGVKAPAAGGEGGPFQEEGHKGMGKALLLDGLAAAVGRAGLTLPGPFVRFMASRALRDEVPSCTECTWDLGSAPVPSLVVPGAWTIRFLRDQQDCLFWYLHLLPDGESEILCSPLHFDEPGPGPTEEEVRETTWVCAPHFEHFVYRFWMENCIGEVLIEGEPATFTPAQRAYLAHYEKLPRA